MGSPRGLAITSYPLNHNKLTAVWKVSFFIKTCSQASIIELVDPLYPYLFILFIVSVSVGCTESLDWIYQNPRCVLMAEILGKLEIT
jgi:hypothetical protein